MSFDESTTTDEPDHRERIESANGNTDADTTLDDLEIDTEVERDLRDLVDGDPDRTVQIGPWRGPAWKREGFKRELERRGRSQSKLFGELINALLAGMDLADFVRLESQRNQYERAKEQERLAMRKAELEQREQAIAVSRSRDDELLDAAAELEQQQEAATEAALAELDELLADGDRVWGSGDAAGFPSPKVKDAADTLGISPDAVIDRLRERNPNADDTQFMSRKEVEKRNPTADLKSLLDTDSDR